MLLRVHSLRAKTRAERRMLTDLSEKELLIKRMAKAVDLIHNRQIYVKDQVIWRFNFIFRNKSNYKLNLLTYIVMGKCPI